MARHPARTLARIETLGHLPQALYGALIIGFLLIEPLGLGKIYNNIRDYLLVWPFGYTRNSGSTHAMNAPVAAKILSLNNVEVVYDYVSLAIKGVSIEVPEGGMVALLGANGAGKSTTLKSISGLLAAERGEVRRGELQFPWPKHRRPDAAGPRPARDRACARGRRVFEHFDARGEFDRSLGPA